MEMVYWTAKRSWHHEEKHCQGNHFGLPKLKISFLDTHWCKCLSARCMHFTEWKANCFLFKEIDHCTNMVYYYWAGITIHCQNPQRASGSTTHCSHWSWKLGLQTFQLRSHHTMEIVHWRIQSWSPLHQRLQKCSSRCSVLIRDSLHWCSLFWAICFWWWRFSGNSLSSL
jgi:hypothetical protein